MSPKIHIYEKGSTFRTLCGIHTWHVDAYARDWHEVTNAAFLARPNTCKGCAEKFNLPRH